MQNDFFLTTWLFNGLRWTYDNLMGGSVVFTIIVFTLFVRLLTLYGDYKSRKSTFKMSVIQPELDRLRKKYANDPQKLQKEQSKLMKANGVSMLGGCLPMLLTMPLFICFIAAFRHWGNEQMVRALIELNETGSSELFSTFQFAWVNNIWQADNGFVPVVLDAKQFLANNELHKLLYFQENPAAKEIFESLGFFVENRNEIPQAAIDTYNRLIEPIMAQYKGVNNGWFVLPIIAAGTSFLAGKITQPKQPEKPFDSEAKGRGSSSGQNKTMLYMMPIVSFIACLSANAAFAVYWVCSNILMIIVNLVLNKKFSKETLVLEGKKA